MPQQADLYAQMGIAAILPGLTRAVEILQAEIDDLRAMLTRASAGESITTRRGRPPGIPNTKPRKVKAHTNGSVTVPATAQINAKGLPINPNGASGYWAKMTPEQRAKEMRRRQQVAATKRAKLPKAEQLAYAKKRAAHFLKMQKARMTKEAAEARVQ